MGAILIIEDDAETLARTLRSLEHTGHYKVLQTVQMPAELPPSGEVLSLLRGVYKLTPRECELVLLQLREPDMTWSQIALHQQTTRNTIKTYYQRIYKKLGISGRSGIYTLLGQHFGTTSSTHQREVGRV